MTYPPSSLYIHIPWCVKKCPYCDFNSHEFSVLDTKARQKLENKYLSSLLSDLQHDLDLFDTKEDNPQTLQTIFIGGGTPSLMSSMFYSELLAGIDKKINIDKNAEITLEANPGTADASNFKGYRTAGINRLSIGAQSFSNAALKALGRIHGENEINQAFNMARQAGFENINLDLMHGLPSQTIEEALEDLNRAIKLAPEHLSWYQLTIEKNTAFYSQPPTLPVENILDDIGNLGLQKLRDAGYQQYEISAYAKKQLQAQHNLNYWRFGDYFGIGAGAHGKLTIDGKTRRRWKSRMPDAYLNKENLIAGENEISRDDLPLEFLMNSLRLQEGFTIEQYEHRTGLSYSGIQAEVNRQIELELLEREGDLIRVTDFGRRYLDSVLASF